MSSTQQLLLGEGAGAPAVYIEDVFSTYLYTGTGANQTITNNIDLSTKGGLTWIKQRTLIRDHNLFDTARGATNSLFSDSVSPQITGTTTLTSFNSNGFSLGTDADTFGVNLSGQTYASWTFRKQPKFFDVVTWTGNGAASNTISHNLGATPGCVIMKKTSATGWWAVQHRSVSASQVLELDATIAATTDNAFNSQYATSTSFQVDAEFNASGATYVAYLFAHNAGGFGLTGTDNVISCGSFLATNYSNGLEVNLGWEPQWLLVKNASVAGTNWVVVDNMRGLPAPGANSVYLQPNTTAAEVSDVGYYKLTSTGFQGQTLSSGTNTFIYIAIRRGPMKVPTDGTTVMLPIAYSGSSSVRTLGGVLNPVDMFIGGYRNRTGFGAVINASRLIGRLRNLVTATTNAELVTADNTSQPIQSFAFQTEFQTGTGNELNGTGYNYVMWQMRRAPSFFDEVCYTGDGSNYRALAHNLGVPPELIFIKARSVASAWCGYASAGNIASSITGLSVNATSAAAYTGQNFTPYMLSTTFTPGLVYDSPYTGTGNNSGTTYVAYLFATCLGVSKVGGYTGTGTLTTINCGFTGGARFVMIKRTDTTGDWYVWDTARGMVAGTDPSTRLNVENVEVNANSVYTTAVGFQLLASPSADVNTNGGSYIYLAIA